MITQEKALKTFIYDYKTGVIRWADRPREDFRNKQAWKAWNTKHAFKEAGYVCTYKTGVKYRLITYMDKHCRAHRLIWFMAHGEWPDEIDHINGDGLDNRMANLRNVSHIGNSRNCPIGAKNTTGYMGVSYCNTKNKWRAFIIVNGEFKSLGYFYSMDDAIKARKEGDKKYGFHPNHGRQR